MNCVISDVGGGWIVLSVMLGGRGGNTDHKLINWYKVNQTLSHVTDQIQRSFWYTEIFNALDK